MPVGGTIKAINSQLEEKPELVNQDPYGQGWLIEISPSQPEQVADLMDKNGYYQMLKGEE
jgi:glycine cleavage system H protein